MMSRIAAGCLLAVGALSFGVAEASGVPGQGTWQKTLKPRDLDRNGTADAFYDTVLDITWLRNADVKGLQFWDAAVDWADKLQFGGYSDWRLPTMVDTWEAGCDWDYAGTDCGYNVQTKGPKRTFSEMAHLFSVTLGNKGYCDPTGQCGAPGWGLTNTGNFQNIRSDFYWIGLNYGEQGVFSWYYYTPSIYQSYGYQNLAMHAMAVRNGDVVPAVVASVPEAQTVAMMLLGLGVLGVSRCAASRRHRGAGR